MSNNDYYEYNLDSEEKNQTLSIGISGDNINIVLTNKSENDEKYSSSINLSQLIDACKFFKELDSLKEALDVLNDTIVAGNIFLTQQEDSFILKIIIKTESEEYPPFKITLSLDNSNNQELTEAQKGQYDVLPPKFDYQGNVEAEQKYGTSTENTTEYNKPIINSDYKKPILQLEYIEPILQVHYPDGTTKSKALPPRIQKIDGTTLSISDAQFKYIQEQMNRSTEGSINMNSLSNKYTSKYSLQSVPNPNYNNLLSFNTDNKNPEDAKKVEPKNNTKRQNSVPTNRVESHYSTRSLSNKPIYDNIQQSYNSYTYNKNNILHRSPPRNRMIEVAPRMVNQNNQYIQQNAIYNKSIAYSQVNNMNVPNSNINRNNRNIMIAKSQVLPHNQNQSMALKSQVDRQTMKNSSINKKSQIFASVVPLKKINIPNAQLKTKIQQQKQNIQVKNQYQIPQSIQKISQYQATQPITLMPQNRMPIQEPQINIQRNQMPEEFDMEHQRERFQTQLKIQQQIVNAKTPVFPSVLPLKIMETKFEFPQGRDYEEKIIAKIKSENQVYEPYMYNESQGTTNNKYINETETQKKMKIAQPKVLPIIFQHDDKTGNSNINDKIAQQLQNYNQQKIENVNQNNEEENLENNEIIEDNENEVKEGDEQNNEEENDIEQLFKTEDGLIIFRNGILRGIIHSYSEIDEIISKIQDKLLKGAKFNLIYRAFNDGDKARTFHEKCDNHQMTLVLIETSEGVRFGGFTRKTWDGKNIKKIDNDAFVFSIETGKCFDVTKNEPAIGCYPKFGPVFFGCQIRIYDEFFTKGGTTCLKGLNYNTKKDYELNNGIRSFIVKDIEVYEIEPIDI